MSQQTAPPPPDTIGPYTLDSLLGTGGMGEVYKAFDPRLDRWVAVKHIKAEFALKAGYRQRLEREAKTIASLDHPSIVQIYDVLRDDDGGEWIVMEMVDGPTVYEMLDGGPLDLGTTLTIALDVIHGLGVAHDQGVLHRDLKSENVMVSRKGVAKILDFGLSKRLEQVDEATLSMEGKVIGTCRVMAPEQADGQDLDGRADLFSFGILLYEMVTARSPFRASTPMASMLKAFGEPHAPVHSYDPDIPQELSDLIDWLLSKNRNHRPENALVVAAELTELAGDLTDNPAELAERIRMASRSWHGSGAYSTPPSEVEAEEDPLDETVPGGPSKPYGESSRATSSSRRTASLSRAAASRAVEETMERSRVDLDRRSADTSSPSRWSSMFSTAFGLRLSPPRRALAWTAWLMALLTGWWAVQSVTRPMISEEPNDARIMVLPFENLGPEESSYFASGLTSELIRELTIRRGLAVVSYRTSNYYGSEKRSLREIGEELDVDYVIEGGIAANGAGGDDGALRISLSLIRLSDGEFVFSRSMDRRVEDLLRAHSDIADEVAIELGAQILVDRQIDREADPLALESYYRGVAILYGSSLSMSRVPEVERLLETAVDRDPDFVQAWTELARVRAMKYFNSVGDASGDRERAEDALNRAQGLDPEAPPVILADGYFRYHVLGNLDQALARFERAAQLAPQDPAATEAMGLVMRRQGRLDEAVSSLERAFDLDRANGVLAGFLGESERARRNYDRARDWYDIALRVGSQGPRTLGERAETALAQLGCGDLSEVPDCAVDDARRLLHESGPGKGLDFWSWDVIFSWYEMASGGDPEEFLVVYDSIEPARISPRVRYFQFWKKVLVLRHLGRDTEARVLASRYADELQIVVADASSWIYRAPLSMALALSGRQSDAWVEMELALQDASRDPFSGPRVRNWAAMVAVELGMHDEALKQLAAASELSYQKSLASYQLQADPIWGPLKEAGTLDEIWSNLKKREAAK